ncbi:MAG: ABC transporter ATP-binding protein [Wenzhouxiangellaceae bacterium]
MAFVGESGSGKSTLLELLAMILKPTQSEQFGFQPATSDGVYDLNEAWRASDVDQLSELRSRYIGYVLQSGGLLPYLTVRENINLSRRILHRPVEDAAEHWAERLKIMKQLDKLPAQLSVGQRQRAAIARALAHDPSVLIADEPTASVDPLNAERILSLMVGLVDEMGVTLIISSHAHGLMQRVGLRMIEHQIDANSGHSGDSGDSGDSMQVTVADVSA